MSVSLIDYPDDCLNLAGDCLPIEFSTDSLQESAYAAWDVKIYDTDIADVVAGSKLLVGGVEFTFGASADTANNVIAMSVSGIDAGFTANHFINSHFDHGTSGSYAWIRPKVRSWEVAATITGLDASPSSKNLSAIPTPVKAKEAYGVLVTVSTVTEETNYILFEATIPAEFKTDPAHETIENSSIVIKKDFGALFDAYLSSYLPTVQSAVANEVHALTDLSKKFAIQGMEMWGIPTNFYGLPVPALPQTVHITKGKTKTGEDSLSYCDKSLLGVWPKTMACGSVLVVSMYDPDGPSGCGFTVSYRGISGSIGSALNPVPTTTNTYAWTLVARLDVLSYVDDITSVRINPQNGGINGSVHEIDVIHAPAETLVYKTSKATYCSIIAQPLNQAEFGNATDFISKCKSCAGLSSDVVKQSVNSSRYQNVTFNLFNENKYFPEELEEFFSSDEVYWLRGNDLYFIEPTSGNSKVYEYRKNTNPVFKGKLLLT